ncbi:MAG: helix-turn-helix transcriptional regulator [Firmicutes bacterium]|nr:helix-turn-helix transcriptional regulator [Bacillota bacterium]
MLLYRHQEDIHMGRKSVKENKNIYQQYRENAGYTREKASEAMGIVSETRIEKIESDKTVPYPDEIMAMAECYKTPDLCNYYCSNECPIGKKYVPQVQAKELTQIVLEVLATLNSLEKDKERLIEISADGEVSEDEERDFGYIKEQLDKISLAVDSLQLWMDKKDLLDA